MVWSRDTEAEKPPLSVILPQLYLGAERDVTQERLASLGISCVLSVSRCSPEPSFLPRSRFLRIPIDDSLCDDLLPWIPQALHFIDAAVSSGASVLVHCAAGISRSPALAVAYIMYSLDLDLDQAYRFVKERRPSISPNFNFLGQLQHFQATLCHSASSGHSVLQQPDTCLSSSADSDDHCGQKMNLQAESLTGNTTHTHSFHSRDDTQHTHRHTRADGNQHLSVSGKLQTLHLTLHQQQVQTPYKDQAPSPCDPVKPAPKPTQLQLPSGSASLAEKRKSLTLSLTPLVSSSSSSSSSEAGGKTHHHGWSSSYRRCSRDEEQAQEQRALSPFSCTLNKLLDWGERVLLGGLFLPPVRMGQATLPYRC
ncbi:hypothetical protein JOB18_046162 [Solea senegalensis]|uniref:protein-tyrosine-phosphatase n=1 Tax=Solea senegalensis TaxID=28829 RepID=A0AAV6RL09_SOLSE|nr:tyrosine-protein phosphatase vhp-1 isoform X1 [Solea senegalensis]XP_043907463.1 tyrosine-protein phosphatase vhp-1 isoform X2 [Solea senegalensis]KAG7506075.1 dual specificity protein phosphatase 8-like [Solea senegalensis]KAG7506076.1 hypothetical protein JOB18_046162 [Solea senegalensis]KAG7506077.1 hypothetical protein JOB18_046162 [Solea senegalensis]KAG7506078.1 hypothetical protein JOB18_046162 [Solea senegalensis]KAG7506079.1 hypothetical protein JOB18_046162 [Solea senegalensis]